MLDALGGMDEDFFLYYEEVALCRSARRQGWRVEYDPSVEVVHLRPLQNRAISPKMRVITRHSKLLYFRKHLPRWQFLGLCAVVAAEARVLGGVGDGPGRAEEARSWRTIARVARALRARGRARRPRRADPGRRRSPAADPAAEARHRATDRRPTTGSGDRSGIGSVEARRIVAPPTTKGRTLVSLTQHGVPDRPLDGRRRGAARLAQPPHRGHVRRRPALHPPGPADRPRRPGRRPAPRRSITRSIRWRSPPSTGASIGGDRARIAWQTAAQAPSIAGAGPRWSSRSTCSRRELFATSRRPGSAACWSSPTRSSAYIAVNVLSETHVPALLDLGPLGGGAVPPRGAVRLAAADDRLRGAGVPDAARGDAAPPGPGRDAARSCRCTGRPGSTGRGGGRPWRFLVLGPVAAGRALTWPSRGGSGPSRRSRG